MLSHIVSSTIELLESWNYVSPWIWLHRISAQQGGFKPRQIDDTEAFSFSLVNIAFTSVKP